jgi:hypothetical protein
VARGPWPVITFNINMNIGPRHDGVIINEDVRRMGVEVVRAI